MSVALRLLWKVPSGSHPFLGVGGKGIVHRETGGYCNSAGASGTVSGLALGRADLPCGLREQEKQLHGAGFREQKEAFWAHFQQPH